MDQVVLIILVFGTGVVLLFLMGIVWLIRKKLGGNKMKPTKKQVQEIEEIEEPDTEEIETVEDGENEEIEVKKPTNKPFCMVVTEGGKAYRGEYLGEEPQFATLQNGQLVKVDSYWILLKTEKVELLKINRKHTVMIAFETLPKVAPQKPPQKKKQEEVDASDAIESIDVD